VQTQEVKPFFLYLLYPLPSRRRLKPLAREFEFAKLRTHREEHVDALVVLVKWYDFVK
jgi:hypothetical protein